jgi:hypothetical protein
MMQNIEKFQQIKKEKTKNIKQQIIKNKTKQINKWLDKNK